MKKNILVFILIIISSIGVNAQTDTIGIFFAQNSFIRMEKIIHQRVVTSGALGTVLTAGIAKTKAKLEFKGATSLYQFNDSAVIRLYFGNIPMTSMIDLYPFSTGYSPKNFSISRFNVKNKKRLLTGVTISSISSSVGVEEADEIKINTREIRPGVFEMVIHGVPGEYCLFFNGQSYGGFGGVYDFTIKNVSK